MKITSSTFQSNQLVIDEKYSAYGMNLFPQLAWSDFPAGTKSFALFVHDKDAPCVAGFWHLQVVDIPVSCTSHLEGHYAMPGFQRHNDTDTTGYIGPKPPRGSGPHEYRFTVYALPFASLTAFMAKQNIHHDKASSRAYAAIMVERNKLASATIAFFFRAD